MEPLTIDAPDPMLVRREHLSGLLVSHRRWRVLFAILAVLCLVGAAVASVWVGENAALLRGWSLGLAGFFAVNALLSRWKSRVLAERLRALEQSRP